MGNRLISFIMLTGALIIASQALVMAETAHSDRIPVTVRVDFGPVDRGVTEETIDVPEGTTPREAVSILYPIESGKVCCSFKDVSTIDGIAVDKDMNRWWYVYVNGSMKDVSPYKTKLTAGDVVEWRYVQK